MGYKSTCEVTRRESLNVIESIDFNKFSNEGLAQILEVINDWHDKEYDGIGYYNYIVKD
jgi:hypothetical protein|tara:strand:- start:4415 stop:4591 length:177 start_codon:yes stop_codon:yes gene_type:complete